jgi:hypothetical protein
LPADFVEVAATMTWLALKEHYRCGERTLHRWMLESNVSQTRKRRELPDNVAELAKTMCVSEIAEAIGWKRSTLRERLAKEQPKIYAMAVNNGYDRQREGQLKGAAANKLKAERHPRIVEKRKPAARGPRYNYTPSRATVGTEQAMPKTTADLAARFLQGYAPCYPRRIYDPKFPHGSSGPQYDGYIFKMRPGVLTADEIVAEAEKRGWRVDSWGVAA